MNTPSALATEPLTVIDRLYAAWAANDADALAALYTADATVVRPKSFDDGQDEVRASMAAAFAGPLKGSRGIETNHSVRVYGDTAIVIGIAGVMMAGESEIPAERMRRATWTLVREDGSWLIAAYHNCEF
ncbi:MAG TPA: SgcJ/EcaC family oxidoreductase [Ilumatobacteraceae bacterium]|jgi:uncharacterized protein (TIGR02246 family)